MSFLYPYLLFLIFPILALLFFIKKSKLSKITFHKEIIISKSSVKWRYVPFILALLIIALARPVIKEGFKQKSFNQTLFIALDISSSMMAEDIKPNRFQRAKEAIKDLIEKSSFKNALLVFTSNPLIIAPPTSDKEVLYSAIDSINPKYILTKSTDIQKLLNFVSKFEGEINLVIFSDGGEFENINKPENIRLFAVKTATKEGALIPFEGGFLKKNGKLVVTRLNPNFEKIANKTFDLNNYLNVLDEIEKKENLNLDERVFELFFIPLLLALILFLDSFTTIFERLRDLKRFLPFLVLFGFIDVRAGIIEEFWIKKGYEAYENKNFKKSVEIFSKLSSFEARYALALSLMKMGEYKKAYNILKNLKSNEPEIKAKIYFALGICHEKGKNYKKALECFIKSAKLNPSKESLAHIKKLVFKKRYKKPPPPFSKPKKIEAKTSRNSKNKKSGGGANINALMASNAKGGKKSKSKASVKKGSSMPFGSKLYDMINKGYINEKNPW